MNSSWPQPERPYKVIENVTASQAVYRGRSGQNYDAEGFRVSWGAWSGIEAEKRWHRSWPHPRELHPWRRARRYWWRKLRWSKYVWKGLVIARESKKAQEENR